MVKKTLINSMSVSMKREGNRGSVFHRMIKSQALRPELGNCALAHYKNGILIVRK